MKSEKVSELEGELLDYWAGKAGDKTVEIRGGLCMFGDEWFSPTKKWSQGGPIIESEGIEGGRLRNGKYYASLNRYPVFIAERQLVAAMRCFVAGKYGESVPCPDPE
jgi:hypothetical protein